jgi:hypothetical protein
MYLRVAQAAAVAFNLLGTLAPVAAATQFWNDNRAWAWVSFGVFAVVLLFGHNIPPLGIAGNLAGWGLLTYAVTDEAAAALVAAIVAGLVYYLIAWQVHRATQRAGRDSDEVTS